LRFSDRQKGATQSRLRIRGEGQCVRFPPFCVS
jgi:hypothetical protein